VKEEDVAEQVLNWGLLSTAHINRAVIPALNASKRNRLDVVASRTKSSAESYAREWNIPRALGDYDALLHDPKIDVIYNSLPNHLHAEWTIRALRAGKHVLCEKPLTLRLDEVDAIISAAAETGKVVAEAFMYRHHPQTLKVKEMVESGVLGKVQMIKGAFTFTLRRQPDIRWNKETGGGSIWDVGCYPLSYARMLAGSQPLEVFGWQVLGSGGADTSFAAQLRFPDAVFAQFDCGFESPSRSFMEIVGAEGVLNVPMPFKPGLDETILLQRGEKTEAIKIKGQDLYIGEVEDIADAILHSKPSRVSLADSRGTVAAILGLIQSAETGKLVLL
jgi:xylose dehydrogenase (NAD/NADP)